MSATKRTFIAVRFSDQIVSALDDIQARLKAALGSRAKVKWVEPKNIHLTLQFLGDVGVEVLDEMAGLLSLAFSDHPPFEVRLRGLGVFPSPRKPRVVWVGIQAGVSELRGVSEAVHQVTGEFGFRRESRPFRPHVTLGRIRDPRKIVDVSRGLEEAGEVEAGSCQIDVVHLVASELRPTGPIYTTLDSFPLGR
jgi:2'-5' RNA ligase